jgi:DNA-binding transcriptional ArsR family regulator
VDASGVSRHLKILAEKGIVTLEKSGRERTYALNRDYVAGRLRQLADSIENE